MRDPELHIKLSRLGKIMSEIGYSTEDAKKVFVAMSKVGCSLPDRFVPVNSKAIRKKLSTKVDAPSKVVDVFSGILYSMRIEMKHRGVKVPNKGTAQYSQMSQVAKDAEDFCKEFELGREDGMKIFCMLGIQFMKKNYGINKFKYHLDKIYRRYEVMCRLEGEDVKELVLYWEYLAEDYAGIAFEVGNDPEKLIHFVYMKDQLSELNLDRYFNVWMSAQFEQIHSLHGDLPEFSQLHGEEAKRRYDRYSVKEGVKNKSVEEEFSSPEEAEYHKMLRDG